ncbi:hypothetical protein [Salinibacterium sp.]|uniref:hypothetical protein n=1 Tax=Salinibacterium sp. TaxID=1915057 RepID=UPI00286CFE53|nr:hypothetical protein [Salinibacterium sp.]
MSLDRADLIRGLKAVVTLLRERGEPAGIRIIGGAALSLRYFERRTTEDVDAKVHPPESTLEVTAEIATANGWPSDWLNTKADHFIPTSKDVGWESLYVDGAVSIWVASAPALLAMKLRARCCLTRPCACSTRSSRRDCPTFPRNHHGPISGET